MNSKTFYKFCQMRSNNEGKANKELAILIAWEYLWETYPKLPQEQEIVAFLDQQIEQEPINSVRDAFCWLKEMLAYDLVENDSVFRRYVMK